jgi:hypothetical protein
MCSIFGAAIESSDCQICPFKLPQVAASFKLMQLKMPRLPVLFSILAVLLSVSVSAVTNADFLALEVKIKELIEQNPDRHIPSLVRNVFHDLFFQDKAGHRGCILKSKFVNNSENSGLMEVNAKLLNLVHTNFPDTGFSYGDIVAFAGKTAVEAAYPCISIDFKFHRSSCTQEDPIVENGSPSAFLSSLKGLEKTFRYLGNSINSTELAILMAGSHGIKGAKAGPSGWSGVFATVTSGKDFIKKTFSSVWQSTRNGTKFEFFTGATFHPLSSIIRLPTDMTFYPSKIPENERRDNSTEAQNIQDALREFVDQDRKVFDKEYAKAITKLLAIGEGDEKFVPNSKPEASCENSPASSTTKTEEENETPRKNQNKSNKKSSKRGKGKSNKKSRKSWNK